MCCRHSAFVSHGVVSCCAHAMNTISRTLRPMSTRVFHVCAYALHTIVSVGFHIAPLP